MRKTEEVEGGGMKRKRGGRKGGRGFKVLAKCVKWQGVEERNKEGALVKWKCEIDSVEGAIPIVGSNSAATNKYLRLSRK